jgi:hypothetical protein
VADPVSDQITDGHAADDRRVARTVGALIAAVGALGIAASAYLDWFAGRTPTEIPLQRLFASEISHAAGSYWTSIAAPLALAGVIGVLGAFLRSRLVIALAGVLGLATLVLWVLMQAADLAPEDLGAGDYQLGLWVCVASLAVLACGILLMSRSRPSEQTQADRPATDPTAKSDEVHRPSEV